MNKIDLLYCGNDGILKGLVMSVVSIADNCSSPLNISVLTMNLTHINASYKPITEEMIVGLKTYIKQINPESEITIIDCTEQFLRFNGNSNNMESRYTPFAFLRLLADEVDLPQKVLYLDTDIVARGNIQPLFDLDISDYEYAGVKDYYGKIFINHNYINTGVMLLNLSMIKQTGLFKKCRDMVNNKKMLFPDQTALNKCATKKLFVPAKYNSQRRCNEDDVLRHFCKSIRWYPYVFKTKERVKLGYERMFSWFHLFHLINVKPWNQYAMHKKLKCHHFDDCYEKMTNILKLEN